MTYYPDLTPYTYSDEQVGAPLNVGWIDGIHAVPRGPVPTGFLDALWDYCRFHVVIFRGAHECELCDAPSAPMCVERAGEKNQLGGAEIRVFGKRKIYAAPNLIYHYVLEHQYQPPAEFVAAVIAGPRPPSQAYVKRLTKLGLKHVELDQSWFDDTTD